MKKVAIIGKESTPIVDAITARISGIAVVCFENLNNNLDSYDLIISTEPTTDKDINTKYNVLRCNYSLLPAFDSVNPVADAIFAGVKVTGITVLFTNPQRIIAQYPIFINNDVHYDELIERIKYVEQIFFPLVIEKLLQNELFESQYVMQSCKCGNCGDCKKCDKTKSS